jgi:hypothetical protein
VTESQLTVDDILSAAEAEESFHTILEVWRSILAPAKDQIGAPITPQWATRMVQSYAGLTYADTPALADLYYRRIMVLAGILDEEIASDDECLNAVTADEDVEHNSGHYLNVLIAWQKQFLLWELEWVPTSGTAAVEVASLSEVHRMFFDPTGISALLEQIGYQFTDADKDLLIAELNAAREGGSGE